MSQIKISSAGWLAIYLKNGAIGMFDLNDTHSWQCLKTESIIEQSKDNSTNDFNRNLIKFSPNGQILVFNGQNKQLNVYIESNFDKTDVWWELKQIIIGKNSTSSLEITNKFLLIADINGDIYKIDLSSNNKNQNLIITDKNCIMKNISILLDIALIRINNKKLFLLTTNQENQICLNYYPNTSKIEGYCRGHTEFISHIKLINNNYILSASGDGTLRLWRLPNCVPLILLHSKAFILSSKEVFYTQLCDSNNSDLLENYRTDSISQESSINNYSIWKMDVACCNSNIYIAFSVYNHRFHSIYLTSLSNIKQLANEQRKLTLDISYGRIIDYCFAPKEYLFEDSIANSNCYLYILFDSNILLKVNIISILLCNDKNLFGKSNDIIQEINTILTQKEFHLINSMNNSIELDEIIFKNSCLKRKTEIIEQEQRKKQASSQNEDISAFFKSNQIFS